MESASHDNPSSWVEKQATTAIIHTYPESRFTCHSCGVCCRTFPRIPVDEKRAREIEANLSRIQELLPGEHIADVFCSDPDAETGERAISRRPTGECIFLTKNNTCAIHAALGEAAKPQVCRDFPYIFRRTPRGLFVGLSFTCPTVRQNKGKPLSEQLPQLQQWFQEAYRCDTIGETVGLDNSYTLEWQSYETLELAISDLLAKRELSLSHRLVAAHVLLGLFRLWMDSQLPTRDDPLKPQMIPHHEVMQFVQALRQTDFREPVRIASKPRPNPTARRTFLGFLLACAASMWKTGKPLVASWTILKNYTAAALGIGRLEIPPLEPAFSYRILQRCLDELPREAQELIERYLAMSIFRKDLAASHDGLRRAFALLTIRAGLIPIYGEAFARAERLELSEAVAVAVGTVENYYGHHSKFFAVIDRIPRLATVFDSFLTQKNFADTILRRVK